MKTAVVFDSAGTLIKAYRVAKDIRSGELLENIVSTDIVGQSNSTALVALRTDSTDILDSFDPRTLVSTFLATSGVDIDVICRASRCTSDRIKEAALKDKRVTIGDMKDAVAAVKLKCKDIYYVNMGFVVDVPRCQIPYVLATGGRIFPGVKEMIRRINLPGTDIYIASGDNRKSLSALATDLGLPDARAYDALSPTGKKELIVRLKEKYDRVVMIGDGVNDQLALEAADTGVLIAQPGHVCPATLCDSADLIVDDILDVERVLKESLHTIDRINK